MPVDTLDDRINTAIFLIAADVVAVDALPAMLVGARKRAPGALIIEGHALEADVGYGYDRVGLSFVLHNFDRTGRKRVLARAAGAPLRWADRRARVGCARRTRAGVAVAPVPGRLEPSPSVPEILHGAVAREAGAAGLDPVECRPVTGGRAEVLVLAR